MRYLVSSVLAVNAAIDVLGILRRALDTVEFGVNVTVVAIIGGFVVKEGKNVARHLCGCCCVSSADWMRRDKAGHSTFLTSRGPSGFTS